MIFIEWGRVKNDKKIYFKYKASSDNIDSFNAYNLLCANSSCI